MKCNYRAVLQYEGTRYQGWQKQISTENTIQGKLESLLTKMVGEVVEVNSSGRTDAGVHANEFCLTVDCDGATVPPDKLPIAVSRFLPDDLSLFYAKECEESFHPRYDVREKDYLYRIMNTRIYDPFYYGRVWFLPRYIDESALAKMNEAAAHFIGKKDFSTFSATVDAFLHYGGSIKEKDGIFTTTIDGKITEILAKSKQEVVSMLKESQNGKTKLLLPFDFKELLSESKIAFSENTVAMAKNLSPSLMKKIYINNLFN